MLRFCDGLKQFCNNFNHPANLINPNTFKMKRVLLLFAAILALSTPSFAYAFESGGIYYNILSADPATVEVTYASSAYNSYSGEVTIPAAVTNGETTYRVVVIGANAFYECTGLTKVVYPASIVGVAKNAFEKCYKLTDFYPSGRERRLRDWRIHRQHRLFGL